jgi:hypothetical protein
MKKGTVGAILPIVTLWSGQSLAQTGAPLAAFATHVGNGDFMSVVGG